MCGSVHVYIICTYINVMSSTYVFMHACMCYEYINFARMRHCMYVCMYVCMQ